MEQNDDDLKQIELGKKTKQLIMIMRPTNFDFNSEASQDNHYMERKDIDKETINKNAIEEHNNFEKILRDNNIPIKVFEQTNPQAYDSLFISDPLMCIKNKDFPKGLIVISPMYWKSRQLEKYPHIIKWLQEKLGYETVLDLSYFEKEGKALEGKGATIFDWDSRTIYAGVATRSHKDVVQTLADKMSEISGQKYEAYFIDTYDEKIKREQYHTSAYLVVYSKCAVLCPECIRTKEQVDDIVNRLQSTGKKVFLCSYKEMEDGATLGVEFWREDGSNGLLIGDFDTPTEQRNVEFYKENFNEVIWIKADTIFNIGGGAVECLCQTCPL